MRIALSLLLALHGIAHLVGFVVPWRLVQSEELPYDTTILAGRLDLGSTGIRAYGVLWLVAAVAFVAAAAGCWTARGGWMPFTVAVAAASLLLSILSLPEARIGIPVNLVILAWIYVGSRAGWL